MRVLSRFRFDHDPDDPHDLTSRLRAFQNRGLELGADVTVWYCDLCDYGRADFTYPDPEEGEVP